MDPELAELAGPLNDILKAREQDPVIGMARDLVRHKKSLTRAHFLDQGAFQLAQTALQACPGPQILMKYSMLRFVGPRRDRDVCPNGEKDKAFFDAMIQQAQAPKEPRPE
jgi:hypothetical protein